MGIRPVRLSCSEHAWRRASLGGGPEWQAGHEIGLELWLSVRGRNYVFVVPPFALMKGL
jgi:hypothetical protein